MLPRHHHEHANLRDLNADYDRRLGRGGRVAQDLSRTFGSWVFLLIQAVIALAWIALNVVGFLRHWDAYPFLFLNLLLTAESLIALALVLMAANGAAIRERIRAQQEFEVAVRGEDEMRSLMDHLEAQDEFLVQILLRLERAERELRRLGRDHASVQPGQSDV